MVLSGLCSLTGDSATCPLGGAAVVDWERSCEVSVSGSSSFPPGCGVEGQNKRKGLVETAEPRVWYTLGTQYTALCYCRGYVEALDGVTA